MYARILSCIIFCTPTFKLHKVKKKFHGQMGYGQCWVSGHLFALVLVVIKLATVTLTLLTYRCAFLYSILSFPILFKSSTQALLFIFQRFTLQLFYIFSVQEKAMEDIWCYKHECRDWKFFLWMGGVTVQ